MKMEEEEMRVQVHVPKVILKATFLELFHFANGVLYFFSIEHHFKLYVRVYIEITL